jgi:TonB-linked SusC/RagA family outer membrane protein
MKDLVKTAGKNRLLKKILLTMKLTTVFLMLGLISVTASTYSQNTRLDINIENGTMVDLIQQIEENSEFFFYYQKEELKELDEMTLEANNATIMDILDKALEGTTFDYRVLDRYIIVRKNGESFGEDLLSSARDLAQAQQRAVSGTVTNAAGQPLPGVTVSIKGTTQGTVTNADGNYTISNVPEEATLVFSFVGMRTQEVEIVGQTKIDIIMQEEAIGLHEVIAVGYRTQTRGTITGSVSTVSSAKFQDIPMDNLSNALAGRLSGVTITQVAGTPGQESNIQIRTRGTLNNTDPLYVIDGIVASKYAFDALSTDEVDNITLLKDAASAAIYGSRGANGVILVTTKRGSNQPPTINYSGTFGVQTPTRIPDALNAFEHASLINDGVAYQRYYEQGFVVNPNDPLIYTQDELDYFKENSNNWIEELWRDPITTQHNLSASGGSETVNYYIGGTYNYATASFDNVDFDKLTLRANIDVKLTTGLTASLDISTDNRNTHGPNWDTGNWRFEDLYKALALRTHLVPPSINGQAVGNWVEWSPYSVINLDAGYQNRKWAGISSTMALNYKVPFIKGLSVNLKYNRYSLDEEIKRFSQPYWMTMFATTGTHNHILTDEPVGQKQRSATEFLQVRNNKNRSYQFNVQGNYKNSFGKNNIDAFFVYEQTESEYRWIQAQRDNFISKTVDQFVGGGARIEDQTANGAEFESARLSYVGAISYNYNRTYLLDFSFRYDGSVIFAPENRWGFFPSASAGWVVSNESFFNSKLINELKLRGSVGLLGNDAVGAFQWLQNYSLGTGAAFSGVTSSLSEGTLANRNITWEKSLTYNGGVDVSFWENLLNLKVDVFYRHTYDILETRIRSIPTHFGANLPDENYAEVNAKGIELELSFNNAIGSGVNKFNYFISGNFGYATNELVSYDEAEGIRQHLSRLELPIGAHNTLGLIATDVLRTQADIDALPAGWTILGQQPKLGMLNYKDIRGTFGVDEPDGRITNDDQEFLADHVYPPVTYGLSVGFSWRKLSVDALVQGNGGHWAMLHANARRLQGRAEESTYGFWRDRWRPSNPEGKYPAAQRFGWPPTDYPASSLFFKNMSFIRLKAVNVSYNLPEIISNRLTLKNMRLFYTGTNLGLLFDHIKEWDYDPEMSNIRAYPIMATHSLGLNITF